jgi:pyruvate carboxylase subunit B
MQFKSSTGGHTFEVYINEEQSIASVNGREMPYEFILKDDGRVLFRSGTKLYKVDNITVDGSLVSFSINGHFAEATVKDEQELLLDRLGFSTASADSAGMLQAPMPGKILELLVAEGDDVEEGRPVVILEAMKMENELKAPVSGVVASVSVSQNDNVEKNQPLLEIEPRG